MEWVEVPSDKLLAPHKEKIKNVELQVFVSPHDVPRRVRGAYDEITNHFVIEFRYIDDDHFDTPHISDDGVVTVFTGAFSGRIGKIDVDVQKVSAQAVSLKIAAIHVAENYLQRFANAQTTLASRLNSQAAKEALEFSYPQFAT